LSTLLRSRGLSVDPLVRTIESSQALNAYSYVENNPLTVTDPSGYLGSSNDRSEGPSRNNNTAPGVGGGFGSRLDFFMNFDFVIVDFTWQARTNPCAVPKMLASPLGVAAQAQVSCAATSRAKPDFYRAARELVGRYRAAAPVWHPRYNRSHRHQSTDSRWLSDLRLSRQQRDGTCRLSSADARRAAFARYGSSNALCRHTCSQQVVKADGGNGEG